MFLKLIMERKGFLPLIILLYFGILYGGKFFLTAESWGTNAVVITSFFCIKFHVGYMLCHISTTLTSIFNKHRGKVHFIQNCHSKLSDLQENILLFLYLLKRIFWYSLEPLHQVFSDEHQNNWLEQKLEKLRKFSTENTDVHRAMKVVTLLHWYNILMNSWHTHMLLDFLCVYYILSDNKFTLRYRTRIIIKMQNWKYTMEISEGVRINMYFDMWSKQTNSDAIFRQKQSKHTQLWKVDAIFCLGDLFK